MTEGITFKHRGLTFRLYKRKNTEKTPYSIKLKICGKWKERSTGSNIKEVAKIKAKQLIDASLKDDVEFLESSKRRTLPAGTCGQIVDRYLEVQSHVRRNTAVTNANALSLIVRNGLGVDENSWRDKSAKVLNKELINSYIAHEQGRRNPDFQTPDRKNISICGQIRKARSIFSRRNLAEGLFDGLGLPDMSEFKDCRIPREDKGETRFTPIPDSVLKRAADEFNEHKGKTVQYDYRKGRNSTAQVDGTEVWKVFWGLRTMGLRKSELQNATGRWVVELGEKDGKVRYGISIKAYPETEERPAFRPKASNSYRTVVIPEILHDHFTGLGPDSLLIGDGLTEYARRHIFDCASKICHEFWPDRTKSLHELRKQAGSEVAKKYSSCYHAAKWLGDSLETAEAHYLNLLDSPILELEDL